MQQCHKICLLAALCSVLAGCTSTRSISNSGYREPRTASSYGSGNASDPGFEYHGELNEFDVLGVARDRTAFEEDIEQALEKARPVRLKSGGAILVVQSGAMFPDGPLVAELSKHFTVIPFSGVPPRKDSIGSLETRDNTGFSRSLRLAAARAGAETIVCCWGIVESAQEKIATKTVSWVPVVTWFVPDERVHMRIRLKLALIDVRTGNWSVLSPPPFDSKTLSVGTRRAVADQKLVERLKKQVYETGVRDLLRVYAAGEVAANETN